MAFLRTVAWSGVLIGLSAACLQAQRPSRVYVAPQGRPRIASIAPPPPPPQPPRTTYGETVFSSYPTVVTPDGRIFIDLGNGYEEVARTCPYAYGYACLSYGYPVAPLTPTAPSYIPPRYAPPAYGAQPYPTPMYPPGGGYTYGYPPPQPVYTAPPTTGYGGCPPGYVPTGSYPPCIDPYRSAPVAATYPSTGAAQASPRRSPAASAVGPRGSTYSPRVVVRRP